MPEIKWFISLDKIKPYMFKIATPNGSGSGFQIFYSKKETFCVIATAYHVIEHEHNWKEPIKITHHESNKHIFLNSEDRAILSYRDDDLALIIFNSAGLPIKKDATIELIEKERALKPGVQIGWCGFPAVAIDELCFFAGHVSCFLKKRVSYLVDGVIINGVSGGPVFYTHSSGETKICGVITAYMPNRATGETLPGVGIVKSIDPYQEMLKEMTLDEAKLAAEEQKNENNNDSNDNKNL